MELRVAVGVAVRGYATASPADAIIEELTEQYSVARDEFEVCSFLFFSIFPQFSPLYFLSTPIHKPTHLSTTTHTPFPPLQIATEETEKKSVYAADDRAAAQEELQKLKEMYGSAIEGEYGEEIKRRVGQRLRELEQGILALEERAQEDH